MSAYDYVFVAAPRPLDDVVRALAGDLSGDVLHHPNGMPTLLHGRTAIDFELHDFDDDDSGCSDVLLTRYPYVLTIRDLDRDLGRQEAVALRAFDVAVSHGWPAVVFRDMQRLLARYPP
jgi:hypothetical protein